LGSIRRIFGSCAFVFPWIVFASQQAYFNYSDSHSYTDPYRNVFRSGDNLEEVLLNGISRAHTTIDIAVHEFRLPLLAQALAAKAHQGVQVRIVLENDYNFALKDVDWNDVGNDYGDRRLQEYFRLLDLNHDGKLSEGEFEERDAVYILRKAGIPIIDDTEGGGKGSALMHDKFMVIDRRDVLTGSTNYTLSDVHGDFLSLKTRGNANNLVTFFDEPEVARAFSEEFSYMWGDGPGGRKDSLFGQKKPHRDAKRIALSNGDFLNLQFSPTPASLGYEHSSAGLISRALKLAKKTIDIAQFVFSDQTLSNQLNEQSMFHPEIEIRALVENRFAFQWYSQLLDMLGVEMLSDKCEVQENNQPWTRPIFSGGTPGLAAGDMLHHKFGVVDGYYTIFGSHNWTDSANEANDETVMVVESFDTGRAFSDEFSRQLHNGRVGLPDWVRQKIEKQKKECADQFFPGFGNEQSTELD
jgi:phosphatidylserine/phosphatidylglycerophosphate/cardiolipin synthase-like enzyme